MAIQHMVNIVPIDRYTYRCMTLLIVLELNVACYLCNSTDIAYAWNSKLGMQMGVGV